MPEAIQLVLAALDGIAPRRAVVGGAFNLIGSRALYGRYWGALGKSSVLALQRTLYRGVEETLRLGLSSFQPGAGGGHKEGRRFSPTATRSMHWFAEPRLDRAVRDYLERERTSGASSNPGRRVNRRMKGAAWVVLGPTSQNPDPLESCPERPHDALASSPTSICPPKRKSQGPPWLLAIQRKAGTQTCAKERPQCRRRFPRNSARSRPPETEERVEEQVPECVARLSDRRTSGPRTRFEQEARPEGRLERRSSAVDRLRVADQEASH